MIDIINQVNDLLWGYVIIAVLVGCGVWFTVRMRFVQFRMLGEMVRLLFDSPTKTGRQQNPSNKVSYRPWAYSPIPS